MIINKKKTINFLDFEKFCEDNGYKFDYYIDYQVKRPGDKKTRCFAFIETNAPADNIKECFPNLVFYTRFIQSQYAPEIKRKGILALAY